jgi:hypothetical protein
MLRRALALFALAAPPALFSIVQACGSEPLPQDLCSWLADANNCYTRFANDVGTQCGREFVAGNDPLASADGFFQAREELEICIKNEGGQVVFDPPLDVAAFPLTSVAFQLLDERANVCGVGTFGGPFTYGIAISPVDAEDAGAATAPDGGPLGDDITGGAFTSEQPAGRDVLNIGCPGGAESHNFNTLVTQKCAHLSPLLPQAVLESNPGVPPLLDGSGALPGYVRLRVHYPPLDPAAANAAPRVVEYFNCLIPEPPHPCENGIKNGSETDVDCGGQCPGKCADGLSCLENTDCLSNNCGLNGGIRQCLP